MLNIIHIAMSRAFKLFLHSRSLNSPVCKCHLHMILFSRNASSRNSILPWQFYSDAVTKKHKKWAFSNIEYSLFMLMLFSLTKTCYFYASSILKCFPVFQLFKAPAIALIDCTRWILVFQRPTHGNVTL